jgi:hypothetical protein
MRLRLTPVLLSLFFSVCLVAQDDLDGRLDAVKEFVRYFKKARQESLQVEAVMTLKGNECVPAADQLFKLLKHKSVAVRDAALIVLATFSEQETFQSFIDKLEKEKDAKRAAMLVKVLGQSKIEAAVTAIEAASTKPRASAIIKYEAARALMSIGQPGTVGLLTSFLSDSEPVVRTAACNAISAMGLKDEAPAVVGLLGDSEWRVQAAAVETVAKLRPQEAVQKLIDLMRNEGRLRTECADALFCITGMDFGVDPDRWQKQWNTLMSIDGWRIPTDAELAKKAASRKKYDGYYGRKEETNAFAGIPTTSTNVLFVIDVSGSMDNLVIEIDKFQEYADRRRFTIVQTELLNTIASLSPNTNFNIVAFATDLNPWKPRLVPANVVNRSAASAFVKRLKPLGGNEAKSLAQAGLGGSANLAAGKTNTHKALMYGFGVNPDKPGKTAVTGWNAQLLKQPLDTMFFLSDGRPSVGKLVDAAEILEAVHKCNSVSGLVIHTIAIGEFQKDFLRDLAVNNGGVFVDMGR